MTKPSDVRTSLLPIESALLRVITDIDPDGGGGSLVALRRYAVRTERLEFAEFNDAIDRLLAKGLIERRPKDDGLRPGRERNNLSRLLK